VSINGAEGNFRSFRGALEGEALIPEYKTLAAASDLPNWLRWMVRKVIDERRSHLLGSTRSGGVSVWDLWQRTAELVQMRAMWSDAVQASGVDAILHPALPLPALPHGISGDMTSAFSYMFIANMLLWPAGVVPVTLVRENEQHYSMDELPMNQRDFMAKLAMKSMEKSAGLPMSVSVMTPAFQDERCLRVMKEVERVVAFSAEPTAYKTVS
jgi:fatty acid amide hydrolase